MITYKVSVEVEAETPEDAALLAVSGQTRLTVEHGESDGGPAEYHEIDLSQPAGERHRNCWGDAHGQSKIGREPCRRPQWLEPPFGGGLAYLPAACQRSKWVCPGHHE